MQKYLLLLLSFIFSFPLFAQIPNNLARQKRTSDSYLEKTILFEVRSDYHKAFKAQKGNIPDLHKLFRELDVKSLDRVFPNHEAPKEKRNKHGQEMVDLSRIYVLTYNANLHVEEVISRMEKTGVVVYAEPHFKIIPLYIPDDPGIQAGAPSSLNQFYLLRMKAYEAWDITKGDTNVIIGIIDTGFKLDHEDLQGNIKYNYNDPIDGIDNDGDGYKDNFCGWDVADDDNDPSQTTDPHGTYVSGCSSASTDNGLGIAGSGFKCKFMPIKAAPNSQPGNIAYGYEGILYAADHGCNIINLSWGAPGAYSYTGQSVINYAVINKNAVIVSAAANSGIEEDWYPGAYENVLSVGGVDTVYSPTAGRVIDYKWDNSTYGHSVDINAQSTRIYLPIETGGYQTRSGTSFASPTVAGAAGLVKSKYPGYTAQQIMEKLRVTADVNDTFPETILYKEKMGKGTMNMYRALVDSVTPAVRMYSHLDANKFGTVLFSGDTITVSCKFRNFLASTSNTAVTMSSISPYVTMIDSVTSLGSMGTLDSANNYADPFTYYIDPNTPFNTILTFRLGYKDGSYNDYQYYDIYVNPDYVIMDSNQISLSVSNDAWLGYNLSGSGNGFKYRNKSLLYEGGLMIGRRPSKVSDCVRGVTSHDDDFDLIKSISFIQPQYNAQQEAKTIFADTVITQKIGVEVDQRAIAWNDTLNDKYIIIEYNIKNISGTAFDTLNVGIFADWDIGNSSNNRADYDPATKLGYVYETSSTGLYAGISLLTDDKPSCYSMDHSNAGGNNINPNSSSGFTTAKKMSTLSNGLARTQAGVYGSGNDVSHVIGAELYNIQINETRTVAFAMLAGNNAADVKSSAAAAYVRYKSYKTSPLPGVGNQNICQKNPVNVTIAPSNGTKFKFYNSLPAVNPVFAGGSYTISGISQTDTVYVTGADSVFESNPVPVYITFPTVQAGFAFQPDSLDLSNGHSVFFVNQSQNENSVQWDLGDASTSTGEIFLHNYNNPGNYNIKLKATDAFGCIDSLTKTLKVYSLTTSLNSPMENGIGIYPNPVGNHLTVKIELNQQQPVSFLIMDMLGKEIDRVDKAEIQSGTFDLDFSSIPQGIYFIKFTIGEKTYLRKFIKE